MLKKFFEKFSSAKRRSRRLKVEEIHDIMLFIGDKGFKLVDMSLNGLAIQNEGSFPFTQGKSYSGELEVFDEERCPIQIKVTRIVNNIIGFDVIKNAEYKEFFTDFKSKTLYEKSDLKKKN